LKLARFFELPRVRARVGFPLRLSSPIIAKFNLPWRPFFYGMAYLPTRRECVITNWARSESLGPQLQEQGKEKARRGNFNIVYLFALEMLSMRRKWVRKSIWYIIQSWELRGASLGNPSGKSGNKERTLSKIW